MGGGGFGHFKILGVFLSIFGFWGILVIFRFRGYFGHFMSFRGILVIFRFWGYFGHFWVLGIFWSFLGFGDILVIFFYVFGIFWSFFFIKILEYFGDLHFRGILIILIIGWVEVYP